MKKKEKKEQRYNAFVLRSWWGAQGKFINNKDWMMKITEDKGPG